MTGLRSLPAPVSEIVVPSTMGPTQLARAVSCRLSGLLMAISSGPDRLPPDPRAIIGTILHRLVEDAAKGRIAGTKSTPDLVRQYLDDLFREREKALARTELAHYVPLRRTVNFAEFLDRTTRATKRAVEYYRAPSADAPGLTPPRAPRIEQTLASTELGIAGKADVYEESETDIVIRDLKTGNVRDGEGFAPHVTFQLRMYALVAQQFRPGKRVRIFVDHADTEELPWGASEQREARKQLESIRRDLPANRTVDARRIASVGESCRWCDVRHVCPRYREEAPRLWSTSGLPFVPPQDVAGVVEDAPRESEAGTTARLRDLAGRAVSVVGLSARHGSWNASLVGKTVWMFGLEARGSYRDTDGRYTHPVNFRELSLAPGERPAFRLRVYG